MNTVRWVRVSFVLMLVVGLAIPAIAQVVNNSEAPGSVLVFHKILPGVAETVGNVQIPRSEIEISVVCPPGAACAEQWPPAPGRRIKLLAHWVCPGTQSIESKFICRETNFVLQTTINGTIRLDANGNVNPPQATATGTGRIPLPPRECDRGGYLIVWVINEFDLPISFNGLIGDAILRELGGSSAYNAFPIQSPLPLFAPTDVSPTNGALDFNGVEYALLTGKTFGTVRFDNVSGTPPFAATALTLLTLDVRSNQPNSPTFALLNFYNEREELLSTSVEFVCWTQVTLSTINRNLTEAGMGSRKGLFESSVPLKFPVVGVNDVLVPTPVTLLAIIETVEAAPTPTNGGVIRETAYSTYHDPSVLIPTTFYPTFVPIP